MFKFNIIPKSNLPQKQTRQSSSPISLLSFDEKFTMYKRLAESKHGGRKLRKFHFIAFEHEGFLLVVNGEKKVFAKLENPNSFKTRREAREVYIEVVKKEEETEGGCYFDEF